MASSERLGFISPKRHKITKGPRVGLHLLVTAASVLMVPSRIAAFAIKGQVVRPTVCFRQNTLFSSSDTQPLMEAREHASPSPVTKLFDLTLPEGRCLCLSFTRPVESITTALNTSSSAQNRWLHDNLHRDEVGYACNMQGAHSNRLSFVLGRLAMRTLIEGGSSQCPILKDAHGRPTLLDGYLGSISHKKATAVALVARTSDESDMGIGIDLEYAVESKANIASKVLTREEIDSLGKVEVGSNEFQCASPCDANACFV